MNITREKFLEIVTKRKVEPVELPGGTVYLKEPEADTILAYRLKIKELQKDGAELSDAGSMELANILLTQMACDEAGLLLLTEADVATLKQAAFGTFQVLFARALEVAGVKKEAIEEAKKSLKNAKS